MHELLDGATGDRLLGADYRAAFDRDFWKIRRPPGFWKLERQQSFKEPGYGSWEAFEVGDWPRALQLLEDQRREFEDYYRRIEDHGFGCRRVRVVDLPLSKYLRWELHVLQARHQLGGLTKVVDVEQVREHETAGQVLPEIYTLGTDVMYQAMYDEQGVLEGATRYTDRDLIVRCQRFIEKLYADGEELPVFFEREVAPLR